MEDKFYIDQTPIKMPEVPVLIGPIDMTKASDSNS